MTKTAEERAEALIPLSAYHNRSADEWRERIANTIREAEQAAYTKAINDAQRVVSDHADLMRSANRKKCAAELDMLVTHLEDKKGQP